MLKTVLADIRVTWRQFDCLEMRTRSAVPLDSNQRHQDKPSDSDGHEHYVSIWRTVQRG